MKGNITIKDVSSPILLAFLKFKLVLSIPDLNSEIPLPNIIGNIYV
ncbi:hypothetical protein ACTPEF_24535 [Clostridioides difficile]